MSKGYDEDSTGNAGGGSHMPTDDKYDYNKDLFTSLHTVLSEVKEYRNLLDTVALTLHPLDPLRHKILNLLKKYDKP